MKLSYSTTSNSLVSSILLYSLVLYSDLPDRSSVIMLSNEDAEAAKRKILSFLRHNIRCFVLFFAHRSY